MFPYSPFDSDTADLSRVNYWRGAPGGMADPETPSVSYVRDRLGRLTSVRDAGDKGTGLTFGYNDTLQLETETMTGLVSKKITRLYADDGTVLGRPKGLQVGTEQTPDADYATAWFYDASGRQERVSLDTTRTHSRSRVAKPRVVSRVHVPPAGTLPHP